jgi:hypothetical protein
MSRTYAQAEYSSWCNRSQKLQNAGKAKRVHAYIKENCMDIDKGHLHH